MFYHIINDINNKYHIILASKSPRRKALCQQIGLIINQYVDSTFDEKLDKNNYNTPDEYCKDTAYNKLKCVLNDYDFKQHKNYIIICADTIVIDKNNKIMEKPATYDDAYNMISSLNNSKSIVITAISLCIKNEDKEDAIIDTFTTNTIVEFDQLSSGLIKLILIQRNHLIKLVVMVYKV